jgi:hypothetical protein
LQIKTKIVSRHTADSKPVKLEVNGTVILPPLVFPAKIIIRSFENATPDLKPKLYFFLLDDEAIFFQSLNEMESLSQDDVIIKKINRFCPILTCLAPLLLLPYFFCLQCIEI